MRLCLSGMRLPSPTVSSSEFESKFELESEHGQLLDSYNRESKKCPTAPSI